LLTISLIICVIRSFYDDDGLFILIWTKHQYQLVAAPCGAGLFTVNIQRARVRGRIQQQHLRGTFPRCVIFCTMTAPINNI